MSISESFKHKKISDIYVKDPKFIYSLFIPLGENSIIQLVDRFRSRDDMDVIDTDYYYNVKIIYEDFVITFYSRGLVTFERSSETKRLVDIINNIQRLVTSIPHIVESLLSEYQLSLLSILGNIESIPIHKSIVVGSFDKIIVTSDSKENEIDFNSISEKERVIVMESISKNEIVKKFIGETRSVDHRIHEDVIIGNFGSIIRSEDMENLLSFHAYNRALHLFLTKYNYEIEKEWINLNFCDDLIDEIEQQLSKENEIWINGDGLTFSTEQRKLLSRSKSQIINGIKNIDYYVVLTQYIKESINFTSIKISDLFASNKVKENSFHIRKVLKTLQDRVNDLKIISESFIIRGRTLVTRIDLYDKKIAFEIQQQESTLRDIANSWKRTYKFGLPKSEFTVNSSDVITFGSKLIFSIYLPLGENSIIQLVDKFRLEKVTIIDSDLYYFVKASYMNFEFTFYSRGLINIETKLQDGSIEQQIDGSLSLIKDVPVLIKNLLTKYHLSLVEVLGKIENIPIHKTIVIGSYTQSMITSSEEERDQFLDGLANDIHVLSFLGIPRSIDSRIDSDVIIGTEGSLIRSEQMSLFLPYHCYNRSLHLFLRKYNLDVENVWNTLNSCEKLVNEFEEFMSSGEKSNKHKKMFSGDRRKDLAKTKLYVINGIKNINNYMVLTKYIEESINFSIERYSELLGEGKVKSNSFHIRKVLRTLKNRTKHLEVVSASFTARSESLISRLELYDSEIAYETQQKIERSAFIMGLLGTILALLAIFIEIK